MAKQTGSKISSQLLDDEIVIDVELDEEPSAPGVGRTVSGFAPRGTAERTGAPGTEPSSPRLLADLDLVPPLPPARPVEHGDDSALRLIADFPAAPAVLATQPRPKKRRTTWLVLCLAVVSGGGLGYWYRQWHPERSAGPTIHAVAAEQAVLPTREPITPPSVVEPDQAALAGSVPRAARQEVKQAPVVKKPVTVRPQVKKRRSQETRRVGGRLERVPQASPRPEPGSIAGTGTPAPATADLPAMPTRRQVQSGFEALKPTVAQCAAGKSGLAEVTATIAASGRVTHAVVGGDFHGTSAGSCVARAIRRAQFPPFKNGPLRVQYPFTL